MPPLNEPLTDAVIESFCAPDVQGMLALVREAPRRGRASLELGRAQPYAGPQPDQILVCGMGGSGSSGDLLAAISQARIPVSVCKNDRLPPWVGPGTLVIGVSYSGNTYETLACVSEAMGRGAALLALSSGGELARLAGSHGFPLLRIPGGLPPRAALFDMLFALIGCLEGMPRLGLAPVDAALDALDQLALRWSLHAGQPAPLPLLLAVKLAGADQLLLWGKTASSEAVPLRWKNQLSENAQTLASVSLLPELNHNEVVGMCAGHHSRRSLLYFTLEASVPQGDTAVLDLVRPHLQGLTPVHAQGQSQPERLLHLVYLGDFTSVYLALLKGLDPTPIAAIDELKRRMA